jgi:hypothetical protein
MDATAGTLEMTHGAIGMSSVAVTAERPPVTDAGAAQPVAAERERRDRRLGMLGAVLVLLAFGTFNVVAVPPFAAGDESSHTNYALELATGRLPVFDDQFPPRLPGQQVTPSWTAVHPPLYYVLVAAPLHLGVQSEHALVGLRVARLLTLLLALVAVVVTGRLAAALVPGRPAVVVAAAAGLALLPSFQQVVAFVYNDALAVLTAATTLVLVVQAIRRGCDLRLLALLAVSAAAATATRASGLELMGLAGLAALTPPPAQRVWPAWRRLLAACGRGLVIAAAVVLTSGWFYLRNFRVYGSFDGSTRANPPDARGPAVLDSALSPQFWLDHYRQLWGYITTLLPVSGVWRFLAHALLVAVVVGLAVALLRWLYAGAPGWNGRLALAWGAMGLHAGLVCFTVLYYFSRGGLQFGRYFFPALPLLPVIAAFGLAHLPGARRGIPTVLAIWAAAGIGVGMTGNVLAGIRPPPTGRTSVGWVLSLIADANVPAPTLVLTALVALLAAGLLLVSAAIVRLSRPPTSS